MRKTSFVLMMTFLMGYADAAEFYRWIDKSGSVHYSDQAPTGRVKKLEQRKLDPNVIDGQASYLVKDAAKKNPVVLFGGECGPLCTNAKNLLEKRGIPYALKDPQKNRADAEALNALTGSMELPVIRIGKDMIKGFEPTQWNAALDEAGYPKTRIPGEHARENRPTEQTKPAE